MAEQQKVKRFVLMGGMVYYASGGFNDYINSFDTREEAESEMAKWLEGQDEYHWAHVGDTETGDMWQKGRACNPMGGQF